MTEGLSSQKKLCGSWIIMVSKYVKHCVGEKTYSGARTRPTVKTYWAALEGLIFSIPGGGEAEAMGEKCS